MPRLLLLSLCLFAALPTPASAGLVISQYYEGAGNNKWIEPFNWGASSIDLSGYSIGVWNNSNTHGYKSGLAPTNAVALPNFNLPSGGVFLIGHPDATLPEYAVADFANSAAVSFDGDDSIATRRARSWTP